MLLKGENLGFHYNDRWTFQNINISIACGEIIGLMGPSGCGKTTLARILASYEKAHQGIVRLDHNPAITHAYHPVQLISQHPEKAVNPKWRMHKILQEGWKPDAELLERFQIKKEWLTRWPNELSGGELQRFCIVRALSPQTKFLIADEITTMLDAITQAQIWKAVLEIVKSRDIGMLVVSHDKHLIHRICSKVILFEDLSKT